MTFDKSCATQEEIDDTSFTEYTEGFLSYMCGRYLHDNPYFSCGDVELDQPEYFEWYDGWMKARECYPEIEPKDE